MVSMATTKVSKCSSLKALRKCMIVGKVLEFASKPEQPGLSSSIRLEVVNL